MRDGTATADSMGHGPQQAPGTAIDGGPAAAAGAAADGALAEIDAGDAGEGVVREVFSEDEPVGILNVGVAKEAPKQPSLALNPDGLTAAEMGSHAGHRVRRKGPNRFACLDCDAGWRMVRNSTLARRRLLR